MGSLAAQIGWKFHDSAQNLRVAPVSDEAGKRDGFCQLGASYVWPSDLGVVGEHRYNQNIDFFCLSPCFFFLPLHTAGAFSPKIRSYHNRQVGRENGKIIEISFSQLQNASAFYLQSADFTKQGLFICTSVNSR